MNRTGLALVTGAAALALALATAASAQAAVPTPNPACQVTYTVPTQFMNHFQGAITVKNTGTTAFNSWRLTWTFANGQVIGPFFGGSHTQIGASVTVNSVPWNSVVQPGVTMSFIGFYAQWNNITNSIPPVTCLTT
jgi:hypothetical protein